MKYKEDMEVYKPYLMKAKNNRALPSPSQQNNNNDSEDGNEEWRKRIYDQMSKVQWEIAEDHKRYKARGQSSPPDKA